MGKRLSEMLENTAVNLQRAINEQHLGELKPVALRGRSETGNVSVLRIVYGGTTIAELPDTEEGRRRLAYYRINEAGEIPTGEEEEENALRKLAQGLAAIAVGRRADPSAPLKKISKMLGGHPLAPFAVALANISVKPDPNEFMGWSERPEEIPFVGQKNVIVIAGEKCPHSKKVLEWLNMRYLEKEMFPRRIAVMLFVTGEEDAGVERIFGAEGTPAFIFCDVYFNIKKVIAGELTRDRFERELISY